MVLSGVSLRATLQMPVVLVGFITLVTDAGLRLVVGGRRVREIFGERRFYRERRGRRRLVKASKVVALIE
ncbi:hypothetical protein SLA2020_181570 [Shorea laevis]